MIKKTRARFIRIAMAALSVAIIAVTLVINGANWLFVRQELRDTVSLIAQNDGKYPLGSTGRMARGRAMRGTRESSYETRYFSVRLTQDGSHSPINMDSIAAVTRDEAVAMAEQARATGRAYGYLNDYIFCVQDKPNRSIVTFVDCSTRFFAVRNLALISLCACLAAILFSLAVVSLLSRRAIQPLIDSAQRQKRFITDAGHELKTPLTVISANMDVLALDLGENEWVQGTQRQVGNLRRLVGDLVTLSRMDEEEAPAEVTAFDLSGAVLDAASAMLPSARGRNMRVALDIAPDIRMDGDEGALRRLVLILLDNAVKYAPEGSEIRLCLRREGRRILLTAYNPLIQDMDDAVLARLFDRFYRADPARAKGEGGGGYGIGLSIARAIAERHGGRIAARRASGGAIAFTCQLPAP